MAEELDDVARFARNENFNVRPYTIFVEGVTDVRLFELAAQFEKEETGLDLLGDRLAIIAAGEGDNGGAKGVGLKLINFKYIAKYCLDQNGRPKYRFIGLFDNDNAGRRAISNTCNSDTSILEYKDVFRLFPTMPSTTNRDPDALRRIFEEENEKYKGLDWELEDLLPEALTNDFFADFPIAIVRKNCIKGKVHRDLTRDGKGRLHQFVKQNAISSDMVAVIGVLRAFWQYLGIRLPKG